MYTTIKDEEQMIRSPRSVKVINFMMALRFSGRDRRRLGGITLPHNPRQVRLSFHDNVVNAYNTLFYCNCNV